MFRAATAIPIVASVVAVLVATSAEAGAQTVEIAPFGGYRVGGDFFELATGRTIDEDGAPGVGVLLDIDFGAGTSGLRFEGLLSREDVRVEVRRSLLDPPTLVRVEVDHILAGGIQEFGGDRVRPFLSGLLGVTRYAAPGDTEVRFAVGAGGGVKLFATRHLGLRLDGRAYVTFVDVDGSGVCGGYGCLIRFRVSPVWQADFTAGVIFAF